ncbi:MAG: carbonate dehydratase [Verrucomicrobia bacterium]|nr:carbonate dehydratase [Verrucomicrobiota bacterium]
MPSLSNLLSNNQAWADDLSARDPKFFEDLAVQQKPEYLWIGCSDSRVPAEELVGLAPGEIFVHRNVANVIVHTDFNSLSVMQFAVDVLKVKQIIVGGHYGCGGVLATLRGERVGLADNWLRHVDDVRQKHDALLSRWENETDKLNHLCELNVIEQVANVCKTTVVRDAWERGQELTVHGWIYGMRDGLLRDLHASATSITEACSSYQQAIATLPE